MSKKLQIRKSVNSANLVILRNQVTLINKSLLFDLSLFTHSISIEMRTNDPNIISKIQKSHFEELQMLTNPEKFTVTFFS